MTEEIKRIREIEFVRCFDLRLIPREYFEQIKIYDKEAIDRIYQLGPTMLQSPFTLFYALTDSACKIKGFLWTTIDLIMAHLTIQGLSIDKSLQMAETDLLMRVRTFLFSQEFGPALKKKIVFYAERTKKYQRCGAKPSKLIRMEVEEHNEPSKQTGTDAQDSS